MTRRQAAAAKPCWRGVVMLTRDVGACFHDDKMPATIVGEQQCFQAMMRAGDDAMTRA